jgi:hypothetical protein
MSALTHVTCIVLALAAPLVCLACVQVGTGTDTGSTGTGTTSDGGTASSSDATSGAGLTGCGADPQTGVVLCLGSNACPNLTLSASSFPSCGFHQGGSSDLDLECICNGSELCPIGVPTTCAEAEQLLAQQQSALQVCEQVSTGGCLSLQDAGSSSGGTTTLSSACQTCVAGCGSTPACYQSCGC